MFFSKRLPLSSLIGLCRILRHNLGAGLALRDVFRQQAERGSTAVQPVAKRIRAVLDRGDSLEDALKNETAVFPPLFLSMTAVGEETGHLPEVFAELENYFTLQLKLRRQFRSQSFLPFLQLILAFFIIALLIFVLGAIASSRGSAAPKVFGFSGAGGAAAFLGVSFGTIAVLFVLYLVLKKKVKFDAFFLRVPGIGPCMEALVLGRFSLALHLTLESHMRIGQALRLSLQATGNEAYQSKAASIVKHLNAGRDLTFALTESRLFPDDFLNIVAVAEEGGRLPEVLRGQATHYHEEAERRLKILTRMVTMGVWLIYAAFMIAAIFHIAGMYLGALGG